MDLKQRIRHGWDISAEGYSELIQDDLWPEKKFPWLDTILEHAPQKDDMKILDAGCGPGFFSIILSEAGFDVTGIDLSVEMIKQAEGNAEAMETDPAFLVMDIEAPDFKENTFDLIVSRNVVWSLEDPEKAYENWLRILKPGGKVLVFDGDYLKDLRDPENGRNEYDTYFAEYRRIYGKDPKCSFAKDEYDEARGWRTELPLAKEKRPDWDVDICKKLGYGNVKMEWVNEKVFTDEKEILVHKNHPYFLVIGEKV